MVNENLRIFLGREDKHKVGILVYHYRLLIFVSELILKVVMQLLVMQTDEPAIVFFFRHHNKSPFVLICVLVELKYLTADVKLFLTLLLIYFYFFSRVQRVPNHFRSKVF
jgi:hypothetical protein